MKRIHCFVEGEVQGVFFRAHVKEWARALGLTGWTRNTPDDRVEIVAEGSEEALNSLIKKLKAGPPAAHVKKVDVKWEKASKKFSSFLVKFD